MPVNIFARKDVQANTPPIKVARLILSLTASEGHVRIIVLHDASSAFSHTSVDGTEEIYVKGPSGICPVGTMMKVKKMFYGTRKAGQLWQQLICVTVEKSGFEAIAAAANSLFNPSGDIAIPR